MLFNVLTILKKKKKTCKWILAEVGWEIKFYAECFSPTKEFKENTFCLHYTLHLGIWCKSNLFIFICRSTNDIEHRSCFSGIRSHILLRYKFPILHYMPAS